jgi:integrase
MGLGSLRNFSLKQARERAKQKRQMLADGIDPLEQKKIDKAAQTLAAAKAITFEEAARKYLAQHQAKWSNAKHRQQYLNTLKEYAFPKIGRLAVADVDIGEVLRVIEPMWADKTVTANRVRGRIESVLDWCTTRGYRKGDNPARLKYLSLPQRGKIHKVKHHPALPYADVSTFMTALRQRNGIAARALEFTALTAARTGAVIGATRDEIDFEQKVWTVPPGRTGAKINDEQADAKPRRIPLCDRAIEILRALPQEDNNPYLFIGSSGRRGLSITAMGRLMQEMAFASTTTGRLAVPHGLRSTFKDWCSDCTNTPHALSEAALWHGVADAVEAAYSRTDWFAKRRRLMNDWARYCSTPKREAGSGKVVDLRQALQ